MMEAWKPPLVLGLILMVASCGGGPPKPYPAEVVENFVASCRTRADEDVCRCAIDRIQRRFSLDEFTAFEGGMGRGEIPKELVDAVSDCQRR